MGYAGQEFGIQSGYVTWRLIHSLMQLPRTRFEQFIVEHYIRTRRAVDTTKEDIRPFLKSLRELDFGDVVVVNGTSFLNVFALCILYHALQNIGEFQLIILANRKLEAGVTGFQQFEKDNICSRQFVEELSKLPGHNSEAIDRLFLGWLKNELIKPWGNQNSEDIERDHRQSELLISATQCREFLSFLSGYQLDTQNENKQSFKLGDQVIAPLRFELSASKINLAPAMAVAPEMLAAIGVADLLKEEADELLKRIDLSNSVHGFKRNLGNISKSLGKMIDGEMNDYEVIQVGLSSMFLTNLLEIHREKISDDNVSILGFFLSQALVFVNQFEVWSRYQNSGKASVLQSQEALQAAQDLLRGLSNDPQLVTTAAKEKISLLLDSSDGLAIGESALGLTSSAENAVSTAGAGILKKLKAEGKELSKETISELKKRGIDGALDWFIANLPDIKKLGGPIAAALRLLFN